MRDPARAGPRIAVSLEEVGHVEVVVVLEGHLSGRLGRSRGLLGGQLLGRWLSRRDGLGVVDRLADLLVVVLLRRNLNGRLNRGRTRARGAGRRGRLGDRLGGNRLRRERV